MFLVDDMGWQDTSYATMLPALLKDNGGFSLRPRAGIFTGTFRITGDQPAQGLELQAPYEAET